MLTENNTQITCYTCDTLSRYCYPFAGCSLRYGSTLAHKHQDFYEIILVTDGSFSHNINGITHTLSEGTLLLLAPGTTHALRADHEDAAYFVLCIDEKYFNQTVPMLFPSLNIHTCSPYVFTKIMKIKCDYLREMGRLFYNNYKKYLQYLNELFYICISEFEKNSLTPDMDTYIDDIIANLDNLTYLNLEIPEIFSKYPYSETILRKRFKERTGMTVVAYRQEQKIRYACEALRHSHLSITSIASTLNFNSVSHFIKVFEKLIGMTPNAYRKVHEKRKN